MGCGHPKRGGETTKGCKHLGEVGASIVANLATNFTSARPPPYNHNYKSDGSGDDKASGNDGKRGRGRDGARG